MGFCLLIDSLLCVGYYSIWTRSVSVDILFRVDTLVIVGLLRWAGTFVSLGFLLATDMR